MPRFKNMLLIYPEFPSNTYWSFKYALKFISRKSAIPPLGLITVAALFPKSYNLKVVDMNVESLDENDIKNADAVFISAMLVQKKSFDEVVALCNKHHVPVIAGGPHATTSHQDITGVDHFFLGEAEDMFESFLNDLENGTAKHIYPANRPDITHTTTPRFDLLKLKKYASMSVQYSRGCPFNCEFCDIWKVYGRKIRLKHHERILIELDTLYKLGWRDSIFFVDDNFVGYKQKVKEDLLPALMQWQKQHKNIYRFYTQSSLNIAEDDALLSGMRNAGFNSVFLGIETPSELSLKETGKFQNVKTNMLTAIRKIQKYGMEVMGGFIIGFDNDAEDIFDRQINFIQKAGIPKAMVGLLNALPGTDLYTRLVKEKRLLNFSLNGSNTHRLQTNFITKMNPEKLRIGYRKVLETLYGYNLKNYFSRCNKLLDNIPKTHFFARRVRFNEFMALVKSLSFQPFTPYGYQYVKFLIRNLIKNRKVFAEVVCMSIEGHHFYKITKQALKLGTIKSY